MPKADKPPVLIVSQLPPPYSGLANNMELYLSSSLASAYHLTCLNLSPGKKREKDPDKPSFMTALYAIFVIFKLVYILARDSPQLIYMKAGTKWGFIRDILMIFICKLFKKKLVCHLHSKSSGTLFLDNRLLRTIFRHCMRLPDTVIVLSNDLKTKFCQLIKPGKLVVIDNIVDTSFFSKMNSLSTSQSKNLVDENAIKILFVGRLSKSKGVWDLLKVVPSIVTQDGNVVFELAGVGENEHDEKQIHEYCKNSAVGNYVRFHGIIRGEQKALTFIGANIFVLPTYNDNMPNVILEAMSAGLPIVSTSIGQIPNIIKDGVNGFIIDPGDTKSLCEKLLLLVRSEQLRKVIGQINYYEARTKYDVEIGAKKMKEIFESLMV